MMTGNFGNAYLRSIIGGTVMVIENLSHIQDKKDILVDLFAFGGSDKYVLFNKDCKKDREETERIFFAGEQLQPELKTPYGTLHFVWTGLINSGELVVVACPPTEIQQYVQDLLSKSKVNS